MGLQELEEVGALVTRAVRNPGSSAEVRERVAALLAIHKPYLSEY
jgi:glycine hydroxymethyltransferase